MREQRRHMQGVALEAIVERVIGDADAEAEVAARIMNGHGEDVGNTEANRPLVMLLLLWRRHAHRERLEQGEGPRRDARHDRNQIVSDIIFLPILAEPFSRPGVEEKFPDSSFGDFARFAAGGGHKAERRNQITEENADLVRARTVWKLLDEGQ